MYNKVSVNAKECELTKCEVRKRLVQEQSFSRIESGIFIRQKEYHKKFLYLDMQWIEASGNYCFIHLRNHSKIIVVEQLSRLEPMLPSDIFIRIHRSYIVNIHSIDGFIGNQLCIGDARLSISAPYRKHTMQYFTILGKKRD